PALLAAFADMRRLITAEEEGLHAVRNAVASARRRKESRTPLAQVRLKAPLEPALILCSGENYGDHRDEKPEVTRKDPEFFLKNPRGVIGLGDDIRLDERVTRK